MITGAGPATETLYMTSTLQTKENIRHILIKYDLEFVSYVSFI